jgi:PAS domain S-box-containing protein
MKSSHTDHYLKKELFDLIKSDDFIFEFIQKSSLDGMWYWDLENPENEWMNEKFWAVLGYDPAEMPHNPSAWQDIIFKEDLEVALDNFHKHIKDPNHPYDQVVRYKHKNGHTVWIRCRGVAIRDKNGKPLRMLGAHNELTLFKEAQKNFIDANEEVEKSKANIHAIIDNTDDSVWAIDADYRITYINHKFKQEFLHSFGHELKIGDNVIEHLPKEIQPIYKKRYDRVLNNERFKIEDKVQIAENKWVYIQISFNPITSEGKLIGASFFGKDVTEEKLKQEELVRAKEEAERSEERFQLAMQATSDGLMDWNLLTNSIYFSPRWKGIIGYSDSELPNIFKTWENNTRKEDAEKAYSLLMHNIENQIPHYVTEVKMRHKEGFFVDVLVRATIFFNEKGIAVRVVGTHTDITESKNATKKLENNELKFRKLIDNMPSGVAIYEPVDNGKDFRFININKSAEEITNTSNKELVGQLLLERFPNMNNSPLIQNLRKVNETDENVYIPPFYYEHSNRKGWRENYIYKLQTGEIIAIFKDVTELKEAEERLKKQNTELLEAKEKAEQSDRLKTEFINNMSHEIRTPMNGIMGFSKLLSKSSLTNDKRNHYINIINNSGRQLIRVIDDIIEISQLNTRQVKAVKEEVCINDVLLELFSVFDTIAKDNNIPLYLVKPLDDEASTIYTDESKLKKVLSNLLENAFKYTNKGNVELGYKMESDEIQIYVKDTGIGIPKAKQKIIFERFSRESDDVANNVGGLGLGLAIAVENVELLGGNIELVSELGIGSHFTIKLPIDIKTEQTSKSLDELHTEVKPLILIAEDEEINFLYLETLIKEQLDINCDTIHAKNGAEAVEICQNNKNICLVLMDIKMPEMDGYEATKRIKKFRADLPIIAQTAYSTREDQNKALKAGFDDFFSKPIDEKRLEIVLNKYLNK